jgi:hypothetical protein
VVVIGGLAVLTVPFVVKYISAHFRAIDRIELTIRATYEKFESLARKHKRLKRRIKRYEINASHERRLQLTERQRVGSSEAN